jgi:hypothetical protein
MREDSVCRVDLPPGLVGGSSPPTLAMPIEPPSAPEYVAMEVEKEGLET